MHNHLVALRVFNTFCREPSFCRSFCAINSLFSAIRDSFAFAVVFGEEEVQAGMVKIKDTMKHTEVDVPVSNLVTHLNDIGCDSVSSIAAETQLLKSLLVVK